ncbi:MAG: hypothetical protein IPG10_06630 [Flavobacteriales bacterium]|nr:hypothetical protein [Flavobacteriales bacterium]
MATTAQGNERMMEEGTNGPGRWWNILRIVGWSLAALMLLFPVVAMQFTDEVNWGPEDFLFAAVLLGGSGLLFELVIRRSHDDAYRTGALLALATTFLLIWSNAAVGFVGSGANTANVLYVAMVAIPFIGGVVSRLKARGLCITTILTAAVQAAITVFAFASGLVSEEESSDRGDQRGLHPVVDRVLQCFPAGRGTGNTPRWRPAAASDACDDPRSSSCCPCC